MIQFVKNHVNAALIFLAGWASEGVVGIKGYIVAVLDALSK